MLAHLALLGTTLLVQPADSTRALTAARVQPGEAAPTVDGRLDDAVWNRAPAAGDFVQFAPNAGSPATLRTETRVAYDDAAVYVAVRMYDPRPDSIVGQLARRDADVHSDWVHVGFDSYHDRRTAYVFGINPRGVKQDIFLYNDGSDDNTWNAVWDGAARVDSLGWTAEFRVPFSQLRYSAADVAGGRIWGFNVRREVARTKEESFWSPVLPNVQGVVSRFGELRGLERLPSPRRLEVQPYSMGRVTRAPVQQGNPFYRATDPTASGGADVKYGITSNFTLTATLNPDFGQVEADPGQVNLTAYETFLPEQRPFFVEGSDIFKFGLGAGDGDFGSESLFYSRRIGRRPQGTRRIPGNAAFSDVPEASSILGAAKVTGKTSGGWSVGILDAVTAREEARFVLDGAGRELSAAVEPMTNYAVGRVSRDFRGGKSAVGGIVTATHRLLGEDDSLSFLRSAAYAGGFDLRHRFGKGNAYEVRSWVLGSTVRGDTLAMQGTQRSSARYFQRPDDYRYDPTRTSLSGWAAHTEFLKSGGGNLQWGGVVNARSPGFETNDIGFQRDADQVLAAAFLGYNQPKAGKTFRRWGGNLNGWNTYTFDGRYLGLGGNVNGNFQLRNFWGGYAGINREAAGTSVRALWGGPSLRTPGSWNTWAGISSDSRKKVFGSLNASGSREDETGGYSWNLSAGTTWRASARANLSVRPSYSSGLSAWQFVSTQRSSDGRPRYVFGELDQNTFSVTARLNYTFTPDLSLQLYAQPFISAGDYSDFREVVLTDDGKAVAPAARFTDRFRPAAYSGNPDFNYKQFRSNAVLRWEYRPGSTLFVVWSQGRQDYLQDGSFRLGRDFGRLFGMDDDHAVPMTNVLLLKVNYWLSM